MPFLLIIISTLILEWFVGQVLTTTDLWLVDQTQISFMGITVHWIETNPANGDWELSSTVIAFHAISGAHDGANLGWYFVGLCNCAGIFDSSDSKVHYNLILSLTPPLFVYIDSSYASPWTTLAIMISHVTTLEPFSMINYLFDPIQHCLPCLAHAINLTILVVMSEITRVDHIATTNVIWEFDLTLPANQLVGDSIDVITTICTLAIKIQASSQRVAYFECVQKECGIMTPLVIPLQNNTRWGTVDGMLGRSYQLRQVWHDIIIGMWITNIIHRQLIASSILQMSYSGQLQPFVTRDTQQRK